MNRFLSNRLRAGMVVAALTAAMAGVSAPAQAAPAVPVVVLDGAEPAAAAVRAVGGHVRAELGIVGGVAADVPAAGVEALARRGVIVAPDSRAKVAATGAGGEASGVQLAALNPGTSWDSSAGAGVGVALVDTGVADVADLAGRVAHGPDLSGDGDGIDRHGHGTFMAGLIAGDGAASAGEAVRQAGVAPGAHVVSVKVAGRDGSTSLARLIEAIGWVVEHAEEHGVGVLNLSFAAEPHGSWVADPLSMAVEEAWASGITVVTAAGNDGAGEVASPGRDPWVITAGATDHHGTATAADDTVPSWSAWQQRGPFTKPDVVAPGVSVISLRAPGSLIDVEHPEARVGAGYFRGSGTSMAAALTSGAAAVLLADHPDAVPDDVKGALVGTAHPIPGSPGGAVDLAAADAATSVPQWWQEHPTAGDPTGAARRVPWSEDGAWDSNRWSSNRWSSNRWSGDQWTSNRWSSNRWSSNRWSSNRWSNDQWTSNRWSSNRWSSNRWSSNRWSGDQWTSNRWSSNRWSSNRWSGDQWTSNRWSSNRWSSNRWSGDQWTSNRWSSNRWSGDWTTFEWLAPDPGDGA